MESIYNDAINGVVKRRYRCLGFSPNIFDWKEGGGAVGGEGGHRGRERERIYIYKNIK